MLRRLIDRIIEPQIPRVPIPRLATETDGSGGEFTQVVISDEPNEKLFAYLAVVLQEQLNGQWSQKLNGLDQSYRDLEAGDGKIVLHLEHYLGISIHPHELSQATNASKHLVLEAYKIVAELGAK